MGDERVMGTVVERYGREASLDGRLGLTAALAVLRERGSVGPLHKAVQDESLDAASRASACAALGRVAESSSTPWRAGILGDTNYMVETGSSLDAILGL